MERFFNIIDSQQSCCLLLYGEIGDWGDTRAADIVRELLDAEARNRKIDVRINSVGGDVYAGIAIFNALRNSKADITIYIDCIAASMASVIASCGKPVKICSNGRMMIHRIHGGAYGDAEEIERRLAELRGLEGLLCDIYAARTGQTAEQVRTTYFDGQDHWLTAQEAKVLGFADEIYDDPNPLPAELLSADAAKACTAFTNRYYNSLQTITNMNILEKVKTRPAFANCADEETFLNRLTELETAAGQTATLRSENKTLKEQNDAYRQRETEARTAAIVAEVGAAVEQQRIRENERENFVALMQLDPENTRAIIAARKPKTRIVNRLDGDGDSASGAWEARMQEIETKNKR